MNPNSKIVTSFPPISDPVAEVLILGTMPGIKSLEAQQYYAHKQNAFWKIMGEILGFDPQLPYVERTAYLRLHHIAVWDVLHSCEREGSLDTAINCARINDFEGYFNQHRHIKRVCFNGAAAERYFRIHVMAGLSHRNFTYVRLPSTSPAHASIRLAAKTLAWKSELGLIDLSIPINLDRN